MGLANAPFGMSGAVALITTPQLLAAAHVPELTIASVTATALVPGFCGFLLAPILDTRFSRRTWAVLLACLNAVFIFAALASIGDIGALRVLLVVSMLCATLYNGAVGGWLGGLVSGEEEGRLGAWFTVGNIGGFGITAMLAITFLRALPHAAGAAVLAATTLLPLLILAALPEPGAERRLAQESFSALFRDLALLARRREVLRALLMFCLPASAFALTNTLGGLGTDFRSSERLVALVAGVGVTFAGVVGSLLVPPLLRRTAPRSLYLAIGATGALFTMILLLLPRTPATFALALIGENIFQSAAFATESKIIFSTIGPDNPIAASQYTVLNSAVVLPIAYMQIIDGAAYSRGGLVGCLLADAGISLAICLLLLPLVLHWRRGGQAETVTAAA